MIPEDFENAAMGMLSKMPSITPVNIREVLRGVYPLLGPVTGVADPEPYIEQAAKRIETKLCFTMDDLSVVQLAFEPWLEGRRATVDAYYWERYRLYLETNGFGPSVLGTIDKDTDRIVGLLENPHKLGLWRRRGLVVGHVQSGKTANYSGVICKAADYGYKFIVVLAGMQNILRRQTQERIEEGFIGIDTDKVGGANSSGDPWTGVGRLSKTRQPVYGTTRTHDFKTNVAHTNGVTFSNVNEPIIMVVKKVKPVLENLVQWIKNKHTDGIVRGVPMLLIDDESDNASVNTREQGDPTAINNQIRSLLATFEQNCYLGYTATPFANIFIDPETSDEMENDDLFPSDFIASLDAPNNYIGASRIFGHNADRASILYEIKDHAAVLPEKHKIDYKLDCLPPSLEKAVRHFVLARAVRILRGNGCDHNSMLVNVSRFKIVQLQVAGLINDYLHRLRSSIKVNASLALVDACKDQLFNRLKETFGGHFEPSGEKWEDVQSVLNSAVGPISVKVIHHGSPDVLDYKGYKSEGLHVIAVGGLSLSRGFTLLGLTVSYFVRSSIMYDTLLQMGRWFGYRDGYEDVCKLFMTGEAIGWYRHISSAIDELREEFKIMEKAKRRPIDFGLKVRCHPDSLIVTARNKMKSGRLVRYQVDLQGEFVETTALEKASIRKNWGALSSLVLRLDSPGASDITVQDHSLGILWTGVPSSLILSFLGDTKNFDEAALTTQTAPLIKYIRAREADNLGVWDVCLYSPKKTQSEEKPQIVGSRQVHPALRDANTYPEYFKVSGRSSRVASRGAERVGLSAAQIAAAENNYTGKDGKRANIPDRVYRGVRTRPLLMLHVLDLKGEATIATAWGISFPATTVSDSPLVEYIVNTVWWKEHYSEEIEDDELELPDDES